VAADTGTRPQTTAANLDSLSSSRNSKPPISEEPSPGEDNSSRDWLDIPDPPRHDHRRHTDVSQELRYTQSFLSAAGNDAECTAAPNRIPEWILSHTEIQELYLSGHGTAPDLIYARGVPDSPSPDPTTYNKKLCTLIIIEIGFCRDLGCDDKLEAKTLKYAPLLAALRRHWGRVEFVAFPIGHAGVTLHGTITHLTTVFSAVRPREETSRANRDITNPTMDHTAKAHDYTLFKSLFDSLTDLAQSRLLGIIRNRKRLIETLPGNSSSIRAHSTADSSLQAVSQQGTATHTHRTRTQRIPESTAII
jgi:hypothetical protein